MLWSQRSSPRLRCSPSLPLGSTYRKRSTRPISIPRAQVRHRGVGARQRRLREPYSRLRTRELAAAFSAPNPRCPHFVTVRSRMSSRSNSASAAEISKTKRPPAVVWPTCPLPSQHPLPNNPARQVLPHRVKRHQKLTPWRHEN